MEIIQIPNYSIHKFTFQAQMGTTGFKASQIYNLIIRNFRYNRFYTLINIGSLASGLCCTILLFLFIIDEYSFDKHHMLRDRIYRLESDFTINDRNQKVAKTSYTFGPVFKEMFPEIEGFVRMRKMESMAIRHEKQQYFETGIYYCDSTVFDIFSHRFIYGTPEESLSEPMTMVLTRSMSRQYFGDTDPCGLFLQFGNGLRCMITAVIEDVPANSHLKFDGLVSMTTFAKVIGEDVFRNLETKQPWAFRIFTYILLKENAGIESIHEKFPLFYEKHMKELSEYFRGSYKLISHKLTDLHLYSGLEWDLPTGDRRSLYLFMAIGIFILAIAAINYTNMATARSAGKAREVGIRKVSGASRGQLISLYLSESILLSMIALVVALVAADLIIPSFNAFTEKSLALENSLTNPLISLTLLGITLLVGLLSGIYPAFFLSSFKPVEVMYGRIFRGRNNGLPRKMLIAFQFFISFSLIFATLVVFLQLKHMRSADLGFEKDNLLLIPIMEENARMDFEVFRSMLIQYPGVVEVSNSMFPTGLGAAMDIMKVEDSSGFSQELIGLNFVYRHYIKLMGMQIILGRDFDESSGTDASQAVLINETAVKKLGWQHDPIGKRLSLSSDYDHFYKVTGVIRDFHYAPLHEEIGPMVYFLMEEPQQSMAIRISGYDRKNTIDEIQKTWEGLFPDIPISYVFLDQELNASYLKEDKLGMLIGTFTIISILIALLGLFSLSSYLTEQYTREIAIRKVFGAGIFSIIFRLSRQYLMFVLAGSILAMPFCWILMKYWLDNFAYRIELQAWWFLLIMLLVALVAELTVIYQSMNAAVRNPSNSLRHE